MKKVKVWEVRSGSQSRSDGRAEGTSRDDEMVGGVGGELYWCVSNRGSSTKQRETENCRPKDSRQRDINRHIYQRVTRVWAQKPLPAEVVETTEPVEGWRF